MGGDEFVDGFGLPGDLRGEAAQLAGAGRVDVLAGLEAVDEETHDSKLHH